MEQLDYNLLFRWFVGLNMDDESGTATTFSKNRDRLAGSDIAAAFFETVSAEAMAHGLAVGRALHRGRHADRGLGQSEELPAERRAADRPPDDRGNPTVNFHGESAATTRTSRRPIPTRGCSRRQRATKRSWAIGHVLMENRHGLGGGCAGDAADGTAEREAAVTMLASDRGGHADHASVPTKATTRRTSSRRCAQSK